MSALEQDIVDKFHLLDKEAQLRVVTQIENEVQDDFAGSTNDEGLSLKEWLAWARNMGTYIQNKYGELHPTSLELLEEAREERMNDLMGGH
jgi:hypothetical protein